MLEIFEALTALFELTNTALEHVLGRRSDKLAFQDEQDAIFLSEIVESLPEAFVQTLEQPMSADKFPSSMFDTIYAFVTDLAERTTSKFYDKDLQEKYEELLDVCDKYTEFLSDAAPRGDGFHSIFDDPLATNGYYSDHPDEADEIEEGFQTGRVIVAEAYYDLLDTAREKCLAWDRY